MDLCTLKLPFKALLSYKLTDRRNRHRMPGQPRIINNGRVHCCLGYLQREEPRIHPIRPYDHRLIIPISIARIPLPLYIEMAEDPPSLPARQPRLGVPKVWPVKRGHRGFQRHYTIQIHDFWLMLHAQWL